MKRKIITKITQSFADFIYERLKNAQSDEEFNTWFNLGAKLDAYCVVYHEIYLD